MRGILGLGMWETVGIVVFLLLAFSIVMWLAFGSDFRVENLLGGLPRPPQP